MLSMFLFKTIVAAPKPTRPQTQSIAVSNEDSLLREYATLASEVGVAPPDLAIEAFKAVLAKLDIPIFALSEVIAYMDAKAAAESKEKSGWMWVALRQKDKDKLHGVEFGKNCRHIGWRKDQTQINDPASDHYEYRTGQYSHTIPLHALRRIATIEKEFVKDKVAFLVSDYAPAPHVAYPDPFLMAVIANPMLHNGTGRFVIDFWDEPGFGFDKMLK